MDVETNVLAVKGMKVVFLKHLLGIFSNLLWITRGNWYLLKLFDLFSRSSLHPNILKNLIPILSIVNAPTADPSLERGRLKGHRKSGSEVRGYSDHGKLQRMKYISSYFIIKYIRFHEIILISLN